MAQCDKCYHRGVCKILTNCGEPKYGCESFEDIRSILPMFVPLGSSLWVIEDEKVWSGTLEKASISKTNGIWLEVTMPPEMPDIASIEYKPSDFGKTVFRSEKEALDALNDMKRK